MMEWHWAEDASWWGMGVEMIAWVLVLSVLIGLSVWAVYRISRREPPHDASPEDLLRRRFAAGEIDSEEYQRRLSVLGQHG